MAWSLEHCCDKLKGSRSNSHETMCWTMYYISYQIFPLLYGKPPSLYKESSRNSRVVKVFKRPKSTYIHIDRVFPLLWFISVICRSPVLSICGNRSLLADLGNSRPHLVIQLLLFFQKFLPTLLNQN